VGETIVMSGKVGMAARGYNPQRVIEMTDRIYYP
jgi:hypothetical protein